MIILMKMSTRDRFILMATASYTLLALTWIFLSDQLLSALVDMQAVVWLSTAKGVLFVLASAAMFFMSLRAVPPEATVGQGSLFGSLTAAMAPGHRPPWLLYTFAVLITGVMLVVRQRMSGTIADQPMLIIFMLPVILSALLGGLGPGLVSTLMAMAGVAYLITPSLRDSTLATHYDRLQLAFLLVNGVAVSVLSELLRRSLSRLETKRRLLDVVISGTPDAIFVKDLQGRYVLVNQAAAGFIGRPAAAIVGQDDRGMFPDASAQVVMARDRDILASGQTQTHEEHLTTNDGTARVFLVTKGPVFNAYGQIQGLFGVSRDITEKKQAEATLRDREQQLARVLEGSDLGYWDWNLQTQVLHVSPRWETMLGYAPGEMNVTVANWADHVHPDDFPRAQTSIERHLSGRSASHELEMRCRTKTGAWRWILTRGRIVEWDAHGQPLRMSGTHTDITERKSHELAQREATTVFESSYEGIMVVSPDRTVTKINPAFTRITGYSAGEIIGQTPRMLASGRHEPAFYAEMWDSLAQHDFWRGEIWNQRKNGEAYVELLSISVVRDAAGVLQHYVGVFSDISQIKAHEAELDRIANYDPLTDLPNRRLLADRLSQAIIRAGRSGKSLGVCFLDLDGFKAINDLHGHSVGDRLLVGVTANLTQVLRADDTLARMGGDEFVLLLSDLASAEECTAILDRMLAAVSVPVQVDELSLNISASLGVSLYPDDNADADTLLRHADQAMYRAKDAGKNRYQLFDPETDRKAQVHRRALAELRHALEADEFVLYYQPKVDLTSGEIIGAEALIRWQHPSRGLLSPAQFLPHIDGSDLEQPLGEWVIATSLAQAESWQRAGLGLTVSANVSANHLLKPDFYESLAHALARHPAVPVARFELEVLETAAIADMAQAVAVLQRCRTLGVRFALDDFGTGYSSLTYLRKLPVDTLKIDQSFVRDMLTDPDDLGIVEGVIRLASAFNRQVIAEGVETLEHVTRLRELGCRFGQGYGIARPMPASALLAWAENWQRSALTGFGHSAPATNEAMPSPNCRA